MNELLERVFDEAHSAWRFRWIGLGVAALAAVLGWAIVFALPDRYAAQASIFVDTRTALEPALRGLTVGQDVTVQLNYVRQSLLSGESLRNIALEAGVLAPDVTDPREISNTLEKFGERVVLDVSSASASGYREGQTGGSVYTITYQDTTRERSIKAVDTVLTKFVEETLGGKRKGSETALRFLESQIAIYEERLRDAEKKLADFKKENFGLMPTEQGGYFDQLQAEISQASTVQNNLEILTSRRAELARQLRGDAVIGATGPSDSALSAGSEVVQRIREAQARLDELLLRFTDAHPDVVAARGALQELNARREAEIASLRRGDAAALAASGVGSNPVYQNIQLQLNQADVEIAALRRQLDRHQARAAELRQKLDSALKVEADFAALNRDYETNRTTHQSLLESYEKSRLGEEADTAGSVRFEIVEPPTAPFAPTFPKRPLLLVGILVGALLLGAGLTYLLHTLNPVVGSLRGLADLTDAPVIGVVSAAFPEQLGAKARRSLLGFLGATAVLVGVCVTLLMLSSAGFRLGAAVASGDIQ